MNEKMLLIIAMICILTGLPLLFISSLYINSKEDPRILSKVSGEIAKVTDNENIMIIDVKIKGTIPVVFFDKVELKKGDMITVEGNLKNYKGKLEFVGEKIIR